MFFQQRGQSGQAGRDDGNAALYISPLHLRSNAVEVWCAEVVGSDVGYFEKSH